jgi:hypothetical protein
MLVGTKADRQARGHKRSPVDDAPDVENGAPGAGIIESCFAKNKHNGLGVQLALRKASVVCRKREATIVIAPRDHTGLMVPNRRLKRSTIARTRRGEHW